MNLLKIAVGMNFLAAALFVINAAVSLYRDQDDYWKYLGLAALFVFLGFFYRKKYRKTREEK